MEANNSESEWGRGLIEGYGTGITERLGETHFDKVDTIFSVRVQLGCTPFYPYEIRNQLDSSDRSWRKMAACGLWMCRLYA
jgi:hypothetical protein